jgi:hypothetical protein
LLETRLSHVGTPSSSTTSNSTYIQNSLPRTLEGTGSPVGVMKIALDRPLGCLTTIVAPVNSNLVQYLLQTDIQKRTEKIQWQIQTLHRDFSPGNPNRENQHILY